jgi:hypothetical protein
MIHDDTTEEPTEEPPETDEAENDAPERTSGSTVPAGAEGDPSHTMETTVHKAPEKQPPAFKLKACDPLAPDVIDRWAEQAERAGVDRNKVVGAKQIARTFRAWQAVNPGKVKLPD